MPKATAELAEDNPAVPSMMPEPINSLDAASSSPPATSATHKAYLGITVRCAGWTLDRHKRHPV